MSERLYLTTPVGRIISGDPNSPRTRDLDNRPIPENEQQYEFGLAIRKDDPALPQWFGQVQQKALMDFQQNPMVSQNIQQWPNMPFSFKISDGDIPSGRTGRTNPNAVGCYVVYLSTKFIDGVKICDAQMNQIDPAELYRGCFVDVYMSVVGNENTAPDRAGVYMTFHAIRLLGHGERIIGGVDLETAFGNSPAPALPAGASTTPIAPAGAFQPAAAPATTGMPGAMQQPAAAPATTGMPGAMQQPAAAPATTSMPGAMQQPAAAPATTSMPGAMQQPAAAPATTSMPGAMGNPVQDQTAPAGMPTGAPAVGQGQPTASPTNQQHPPHPQILGAPGSMPVQ